MNKKVLIPVIAICLIPIIVLAILLAMGKFDNHTSPVAEQPGGLVWDDSVTSGTDLGGMSKEEIQDALNEKVSLTSINISMRTHLVFDSGTAEGKMNIVNSTINNFPQSVYITRNDTGEVIYQSNAIPVGSKIETDKLDVDLPAGEYACTATFSSLNPETGGIVGQAKAVINISILT